MIVPDPRASPTPESLQHWSTDSPPCNRPQFVWHLRPPAPHPPPPGGQVCCRWPLVLGMQRCSGERAGGGPRGDVSGGERCTAGGQSRVQARIGGHGEYTVFCVFLFFFLFCVLGGPPIALCPNGWPRTPFVRPTKPEKTCNARHMASTHTASSPVIPLDTPRFPRVPNRSPTARAQARLLEAIEDAGFEGRLLGSGDSSRLALSVPSLASPSGAGALRAALGAVPGVDDVSVDPLTQRAEVVYDQDQVGPRALLLAAQAAGFEAAIAEDMTDVQEVSCHQMLCTTHMFLLHGFLLSTCTAYHRVGGAAFRSTVIRSCIDACSLRWLELQGRDFSKSVSSFVALSDAPRASPHGGCLVALEHSRCLLCLSAFPPALLPVHHLSWPRYAAGSCASGSGCSCCPWC